MYQDWTPIIFKKPAPTNAKDALGRAGYTTMSKSKISTNSTNSNVKIEGQFASKLDKTEIGDIKKISMSLGIVIRNRRTEKKLTQKALANLVNEKQDVIANYETGKAKYNQQILNKLERQLGIYLSGSHIGELKGFGRK